MAGFISSSSHDSDDTPPAAAYTEGYNRIGDRKGKGTTRNW